MTEEGAGGSQPVHQPDADSDVDWLTWLRSRLEENPTWEQAEPGLARAVGVKALDQAIEARSTGPDPVVMSRLGELAERIAALPVGPDRSVMAELQAIRDAVATLPVAPDAKVIARLSELGQAIARLPTAADPSVITELRALRDTVDNLPTDPDPAMAAELRSISAVVASLPASQDTQILRRLQSLTEAVHAWPNQPPHPEILARMSALQRAVGAIPTVPDPALAEGFHALRAAVDAFVDVVAEIPAMVRRVVNARSEESEEVIRRMLGESAFDSDGFRRSEDAVTALRHGVTERLQDLSVRMKEVVERQAASDHKMDAVARILDRLALEVESTKVAEVTVAQLDDKHIEAIAMAVSKQLRETRGSTAAPGRPRRTKPIDARRLDEWRPKS